MLRSLVIALALGRVFGCETDADCDGTLTCVIQADGYYSECIDCSPDAFQSQCMYWSEEIFEAAEEACGIDTCDGRATTCASDADCDDGLSCVVESESYSACTNCTDSAFQASCPYWSDTFLAAAEEVCGISICDGKEPSCATDADCDSEEVCVIESNGYAQCVACASFQDSCAYWSDTFLEAAEAACGVDQCDAKVYCTTADDCTQGSTNTTICVVEADGLYAQCIDCDPTSFAEQCVYWSEDIRDAAQKDCREMCNTTVPAKA